MKELTAKLGEVSLSVKRRAIGTEFSRIKKNDGCHLYVYDKKAFCSTLFSSFRGLDIEVKYTLSGRCLRPILFLDQWFRDAHLAAIGQHLLGTRPLGDL